MKDKKCVFYLEMYIFSIEIVVQSGDMCRTNDCYYLQLLLCELTEAEDASRNIRVKLATMNRCPHLSYKENGCALRNVFFA